MRYRHVLAVGITFVGVAVIWWFATARQQEDLRALSRRWVGEQWDIARRCVVGTPGERGDEEAIARRLAAQTIMTLAEATRSPARPDQSSLWPARCVPLLGSLRHRREGGPEAAHAIGRLDALLPGVLVLGDVAGSLQRARAIAPIVVALDASLPAGAEYDLSEFEAPAVDVEAIEASLACDDHAPEAPAACPALEIDEDDYWFVSGGERRRIRPEPDRRASVWTCGPPLAIAWPRGARTDTTRWMGVVCADECHALPGLSAGPALELVTSGSRIVAVSTGRWTDLPVARVLGADGWGPPIPIARGAVRGTPEGLEVTGCGERWRFEVP